MTTPTDAILDNAVADRDPVILDYKRLNTLLAVAEHLCDLGALADLRKHIEGEVRP